MLSKQSLLTLSALYLFTVGWNYLFSDSVFYVMLVSTLFMMWMGYYYSKMEYLHEDTTKFIGHILFSHLNVQSIMCILKSIYNVVFYFGFTTTIFGYLIILLLQEDDFINEINKQVPYVKIMSKVLNYLYGVYTQYIEPYHIPSKVYDLLYENLPLIYNKIYESHKEFKNNKWSNIILSKMNNNKKDIKATVTKYAVKQMMSNSLNIDHIKSYDDVDMDVEEVFDDLDDDVSSSEENKVETVKETTDENKVETSNNDKRALLRKKIAEKKAGRSVGSKPQRSVQPSIQLNHLANMPGMGEAVQTMMNDSEFMKNFNNPTFLENIMSNAHLLGKQ